MLPGTDVELATACQAIIANENRLRTERNRLSEERERYRREHDESVPKNATYKGQVNTLTTQMKQLRSIGSNTDTASGKEIDYMRTQIATLNRDNAVLNGHVCCALTQRSTRV